MADAEPHAAILLAAMRVDRAQAVMAGRTATGLHLDAEGIEIELVMEGGQRRKIELVETQRFADRAAAVVHIRGGLEQEDAGGADTASGNPALEALLPRFETMGVGDRVHGHEADIMPVERIFRARIAEADPDLHDAEHRPGESQGLSRQACARLPRPQLSLG